MSALTENYPDYPTLAKISLRTNQKENCSMGEKEGEGTQWLLDIIDYPQEHLETQLSLSPNI